MSKTILIIDGGGEERRVLAEFFAFVGGTVLEAGNGEEGLRMAREHLPDLVLLDLAAPVLDGWETLRRLREDPLTAPIQVIALAAHPLDRERAEEAGFCDCLEKPAPPFRVLEAVEHCVGRLYQDADAPEEAASAG